MCSEVRSLHCQFKLVHFCKLGVELLGPLFHGTRTLRNVQQEIKQFSPHLNAKIIHPAVHRCVCTKYKEWQFTSKLTPPPVTDGCWKLDKPELRTLTCSHYPPPLLLKVVTKVWQGIRGPTNHVSLTFLVFLRA